MIVEKGVLRMRKVFKKLCKGLLLVTLVGMCMPHTVEATQLPESGVLAENLDVTTTGLSIDLETEESTYKAGNGTISWKPATVDGEGNVTSPAKLILNNATIQNDTDGGGLMIQSNTDVVVEVIGSTRIGNAYGEYTAFYVQRDGSDEEITVTFTGSGALYVETSNEADMDLRTNVVLKDGVTISSELINVSYDLQVKDATINAEGLFVGNLLIENDATVNVGFIEVYGAIENAGELNAVVSLIDTGEIMTVYGEVVLTDDGASKYFIEIGSTSNVVISEGATLTVPEGTGLDLSEKELTFATDSSLVVEGEVVLPADTTAQDIANMNITGDGVVVVVGATDTEEETEEKVYTTEGKELNVLSGLDFTNVGSADGQTAPTGDGYTWDATSKTLNLSNAYIDGFLNLPAGSKIVVSGVNIVAGDVTVAGTISDAFTLSGEGSIASSGGKKYVSHSYKEPIFTWTKTEDGYTAKATFVCQGGEDTQVVDAKVTATTTDATYTVEGKVVYEAKVTFDGKDYTDSKEDVIPKNELMGIQIEDAKSKAIYTVTSVTATGGTVEYVKHKSKTVKTVTIPKTITMDGLTFKVTSIGAKAFKGYKKLSKVTIGNNVKTIGKEAFSGCKKLKTVKLGSNVTTIGDKAFYNCIKITSITIPSKVTKIGKSVFEKCKKLKTITIKSKKLTAKKVGAKAFKGIKSNATIKVPKKKYKTYKSMLYKKGVSKKARFKKI